MSQSVSLEEQGAILFAAFFLCIAILAFTAFSLWGGLACSNWCCCLVVRWTCRRCCSCCRCDEVRKRMEDDLLASDYGSL